MIVMRHIFAVNSKRKALINHLDTLLDERVLLGTSIASQEYLRFVSCDLDITRSFYPVQFARVLFGRRPHPLSPHGVGARSTISLCSSLPRPYAQPLSYHQHSYPQRQDGLQLRRSDRHQEHIIETHRCESVARHARDFYGETREHAHCSSGHPRPGGKDEERRASWIGHDRHREVQAIRGGVICQ